MASIAATLTGRRDDVGCQHNRKYGDRRCQRPLRFEDPRQFRRDQIIYDPWHYLPVLMKKPGALRNGAPFKDWALPPTLTQVRAKLKQHVDGDRQFVKVLSAVLDHGMAAVEAACTEALEAASPVAM